jgi:hypothetical protein
MEADISLRLARRLFGRPLIQNSFRGAFVEELIAPALSTRGWRHCGDDWSSWDFQHETGTRLELKQSALVQSWSAGHSGHAKNPSFNISEKTGYWVGGDFHSFDVLARPSDLYVFAWHGIEDRGIADHRRLDQWMFYLVAAYSLPARQKTIALSVLRRLGAVGWAATELADKVESVRNGLK